MNNIQVLPVGHLQCSVSGVISRIVEPWLLGFNDSGSNQKIAKISVWLNWSNKYDEFGTEVGFTNF